MTWVKFTAVVSGEGRVSVVLFTDLTDALHAELLESVLKLVTKMINAFIFECAILVML